MLIRLAVLPAALALVLLTPGAGTTQSLPQIATLFDLLTDVEGGELDQGDQPLTTRDGNAASDPDGWTDIQDITARHVELNERAAAALPGAAAAHRGEDLLVSPVLADEPTRVWRSYEVRVDDHIPRPLPEGFQLTIGCTEPDVTTYAGPDVDAKFNVGSWDFTTGSPIVATAHHWRGARFVQAPTDAFVMTKEDVLLAMIPLTESDPCEPYQATVGNEPGSWDRFTFRTDDAPPLLPSTVEVAVDGAAFALAPEPGAADTVGDETSRGMMIGIAVGAGVVAMLGIAFVLLRPRFGRALP